MQAIRYRRTVSVCTALKRKAVRKAGEKPAEYLKIKMDEVLVSSIKSRIPQDDKGAPGTAIPMTWDIATNANN
jgi:hypothetical protein